VDRRAALIAGARANKHAVSLIESFGRKPYLTRMHFLNYAAKPQSGADGPVRLKTALWRGLTGRCPHCGKGRLFRAFLKVADQDPLLSTVKLIAEPWDAATKHDYQKRFQDNRERWLDQGHGECLLKNEEVSAIVVDSLRHFDSQRYVLDAFVAMPNHVHVLVQPAKDYSLSDILHSWKSSSGKSPSATSA